jgi:hypothetical protein
MTSERDQKFISFWSKKRTLGRWKYSFFNGVVQWVWPVFILSELFKFATNRNDYVLSATRLFTGFMIWTVLGFLAWGLWMWRSNEKNFERIKKENPEM